MAIWQQVLTSMTRSLINDFGSTTVYDDFFIQKTIVLASILVNAEFPFLFNVQAGSPYTYDMNNYDISPDPVQNFDMIFIALVVLKTACLIQQDTFQNKIANGFVVKDGDSSINLENVPKYYAELLQMGPCKAYSELLKKQSAWASSAKGAMIASGGLSHPSLLISQSYGTIFGNMWGGGSFGGGVC